MPSYAFITTVNVDLTSNNPDAKVSIPAAPKDCEELTPPGSDNGEGDYVYQCTVSTWGPTDFVFKANTSAGGVSGLGLIDEGEES